MLDFLFIKSDGEHLKLLYCDIIYVEAVNKYVKIITGQKYFLVPVTMNNLEKMLPHTIFRRIHRSYIVSLHHINKFDNNVTYVQNKKLPIGSRYKENLLAGITVLCTETKTENKLSSGDIDKLLRGIHPQ